MLGIAPLNFSTMRERCAAIEESVHWSQDALMSNRSILDGINAAKQEASQSEVDRTQMPDEETPRDGAAAKGPYVDRCRIIEENVHRIGGALQARADTSFADEDITQLQEEPDYDRITGEAKAASEARQYLLFGIKPASSVAMAGMMRPSSAPAGARARPSSSTSAYARPASAVSAPARPGSAAYARPGSAAQARPGSAARSSLGPSGSRPSSANSMRARMALLEQNVARNKATMTTNREGIEFVKLRRQQAAQAMTQLMLDLKPVDKDACQ